MMEGQNNIRPKDFAIFGGVIVLTTVVVMLGYGWLYGFADIGAVVSKTTAATPAAFMPANKIPLHQQMPYPYGAYNQVAVPGVQGRPPGQRTAFAGQYVCPRHGAVGTPSFAPGGIAQCPICGSRMAFKGQEPARQFGFWGQ